MKPKPRLRATLLTAIIVGLATVAASSVQALPVTGGAHLDPRFQSQSAHPGGQLVFRLTLENTGSGPNVFRLNSSGALAGWNATVSPPVALLQANGTANVTLNVTVGSGATSGATVDLKIFAAGLIASAKDEAVARIHVV